MSDNPVLTIAGVIPGSPEMTSWRTAMNTATYSLPPRTSASRGPALSIGGIAPATPTASWRTAYPNGEAVYVVALRAAEARAALAAKVTELPRRTPTSTGVSRQRKAA